MLDLLQTLFWTIIAIGLLVTVHEYGHFWVARRLGVKVTRFSVGFGRPLWSRNAKDGVEYVIAAIPLGGYVKMADEREGDVSEADLPRAFNRQKLGARSAIVAAGPAFNLVFAFIVYWLLFMAGETGLRPILDTPPDDTVAAEAGFRAGDEIIAIDETPATNWERVLYLLVSHAVDDDAAVIRVADRAGGERDLVLPASALLVLTQDQGALEQIGLIQKLPEIPAIIGRVVEDSPADQAGLMPGDRVISVAGEAVDNWTAWSRQIRESAGRVMQVTVERGSQSLTLQLIPGERESDEGVIGFAGVGYTATEAALAPYMSLTRYAPLPAVGRAIEETWDMSLLTLKVIGGMLTGRMSVESIGGPITIARAAGTTAEIGIGVFFKFLAMLSVTIAVLNLLPIPILDGGHLAFYFIEALKGSPVSDEVQARAQGVGMAIMAGIMLLALYVDLGRLFG